MTGLLAGLLVVGIAAPHVLPLGGASPAVAATIWLSALCLRALTVVYVVVYLVLVLPDTQIYTAITHWCWHTVLPLLTTHLGLNGHRLADAAVILPGSVLAFSVVSVAVGVVRAARSVRSALTGSSLGSGPAGSLIVAGADVLLAAAGITSPRVFVSAGALATLEDDELAAGLDHERAHIVRRHRFILLFAELSRSLARFVPGTEATVRELRFHLERDADHWALARRHHPHALAGAICKAAVSRAPAGPGIVLLSGHGPVTRRVDELVDPCPTGPGRGRRRALACAAAVMALFALALAASVPAAVYASAGQPEPAQQRHCKS